MSATLYFEQLRDIQVRWEGGKDEIFALKDKLISLEAELKVSKTEADRK